MCKPMKNINETFASSLARASSADTLKASANSGSDERSSPPYSSNPLFPAVGPPKPCILLITDPDMRGDDLIASTAFTPGGIIIR